MANNKKWHVENLRTVFWALSLLYQMDVITLDQIDPAINRILRQEELSEECLKLIVFEKQALRQNGVKVQ